MQLQKIDYFYTKLYTMIAADMMSSDEVLDYIRKSRETVRPVNMAKFAKETGINISILSMAVNNQPSPNNGKVPTIKMEYLIRATEIIQMLEQEKSAKA